MKIYEVPKERRYWVVRSDNGKYYDHFTKYGLVALGHLNFLRVKESFNEDVSVLDPPILEDSFKTYHEERKHKKQRVFAEYGQVKAFIYEMSVGDWVLTVGNKSIRFGRIISKPFIKNEIISIVYNPQTGDKVDMDYSLRRQVQWGPSILRGSLPYGLIRSLKANQTVFCLDKNWEAVYHSLYPAFYQEDKLYLSIKITTEDKIKNFSITALFNLLNEIEVIGKELALDHSLIESNFDDIYESYKDADKLSTTTKAEFHSPGEIWNTILALSPNIKIDKWVIYTVLGYILLFGNSKLGFDGVVDLETRKNLWNLLIDRVKTNKAEKAIESLKLEMPTYDTKMLEDDSNDKSPEL